MPLTTRVHIHITQISMWATSSSKQSTLLFIGSRRITITAVVLQICCSRLSLNRIPNCHSIRNLSLLRQRNRYRQPQHQSVKPFIDSQISTISKKIIGTISNVKLLSSPKTLIVAHCLTIIWTHLAIISRHLPRIVFLWKSSNQGPQDLHSHLCTSSILIHKILCSPQRVLHPMGQFQLWIIIRLQLPPDRIEWAHISPIPVIIPLGL